MKLHKLQSTLAACLLALATHCHAANFSPLPPKEDPFRVPPYPSLNKAVDSAAAPANLRAVAARTSDPEVWLGLSFLAQAGDPVRPELSERAVKAKPELGPAALVMAIAMDGPDDSSIAKLIQRDPDNALGYYLLGRESKPGGEKELFETFRKGAACPEFRLYEGTISNALFKTLDALDLKGQDRLCASSWMATRWTNFKFIDLQTQRRVLWETAEFADMKTKKEVSDMMLALAGHLIASDFLSRMFGEWTLVNAFHLKADIAASEKSPAASSYASAIEALASTSLISSRGFQQMTPELTRSSLPLALFPDQILRAFIVVDPNLAKEHLDELTNRPAQDPQFDKAYEQWVRTSKALIQVALPDQDEIIGAYFGGYMPPRTNAPIPWSSTGTYVERLVKTKPDLFAAAAANERAMGRVEDLHRALLLAKRNASLDPATAARNECIDNLRRIDAAKQTWALEMGKQSTDTPSWSDIRPDYSADPNAAMPKCPSGGTYTIGAVGEKPTCSTPGHALP